MKNHTPQSQLLSIGLFLFCLFLLPACNILKQSTETTLTTNDKRSLKAFLFPYIPDAGEDNFAGLIKMLEEKFEADNPDVDLTITMDANVNIYDTTTIQTMLGDGDGAYDVVELDAVLLNYLVDQDLVPDFDSSFIQNIYPSAWTATQKDGKFYGMPTYLCSNIIYAYSTEIENAANGTELVEVLKGLQSGPTPLVGNFAGSWTLPSTYIDAYGDTYDNQAATLLKAYSPPLDAGTMVPFSQVVDACQDAQGKNPCLDGTYKDNSEAEQLLAANNANGFIGYSERLYYISKFNPDTLPDLISAPIGGGSNPVMFVDALFFNKECANSNECGGDASNFMYFMNQVETRNIIAFSLDVPQEKRIPRYLLQANKNFYTSAPAKDNGIYQKLKTRVTDLALPIPSDDLLNRRHVLNDSLKAALDNHEYDPQVLKSTKSVKAAHYRALSRFPERFD
ncbi:MAG: extracellular solute-binding protein [Bacteroidota bacterium]